MKRRKIELAVSNEGVIRFIYSDDARFLLDAGEAKIKRVSNVEPWDEMGRSGAKWGADLQMSGGPLLGPFERRQDALDAEVVWLRGNRL